MSEPIEDIIRKLALQNAVFFKGKANPKAIVGKILGQYPEYRAKVAEITETITGIVEDVNAMGFDAQKAELFALGSVAPVLWSANFSLGVAVFVRALQAVSGVLKPDFDIEITEVHHNQKADAPSGTAKLLLDAIDPQHQLTPVYGREGNCGKRDPKEIGVHALRGGTVAGTHTVHFFGLDEEFELTHRAASRQIFVNGALHMARILKDMPKGVYDLQKLLFKD